MQPLYTEQEFESAKSRQLLPLQCLHCLKSFLQSKHYISKALAGKTHIKLDFCSHKCASYHRYPPVFVECFHCHRMFQKSPAEIKKTKHNFCNHSCAAKYTNTHKTKGTRISKLEIWLSKQLPSLYPALEFHFNRKDTINGELDIYIPSLKLAFELNGIFHYIPIFGKDKLNKIQTNDISKVQACIEHNIGLCIIDVSTMLHFKEHRAEKFLAIIQNIINAHLSGSLPASSAVA